MWTVRIGRSRWPVLYPPANLKWFDLSKPSRRVTSEEDEPYKEDPAKRIWVSRPRLDESHSYFPGTDHREAALTEGRTAQTEQTSAPFFDTRRAYTRRS